MSRAYKPLLQQEFSEGIYKLVPLRDEDKYAIMQWRNEQIDILRQKDLLTKEKQDIYFRNVVDKLFEEEKPAQLLFSFLENDKLIGYGGLVHIDWESRNGEISFITSTERTIDKDVFSSDWKVYLKILKKIAELELNFIKIYTFSYNIRPQLYEILNGQYFLEEARLKNHIYINKVFEDVLIHSFFFVNISTRLANENDMELYHNWANDSVVRGSSFNPKFIDIDTHKNWFLNRLKDHNSLLMVVNLEEEPIGQIRFDKTVLNEYEIDFSIDSTYRGKGLGSLILRRGTNELFKRKPKVDKVIGIVKKENVSSIRSFINAGFKKGFNNELNGTVSFFLNRVNNL